MKQATIQQLEVTANAAFEHIATQQAHLDEARKDYENSVASGEDDLLDEQEAAIAHYSNLLQRAERRHAALLAEIECAKAKEARESGNAALEQSQIVIAEMQSLMNQGRELSERAEEIANRISALTAQASEARRMAVHYGVKVEYAPRFTPPDLAKAHAAFSRIVGAGDYVWRSM